MHLLGVEKDAVLDIAYEGVVGEAVPKAGDHVIELARPIIAVAMLHVFAHAEIERCIRVGGGDDVPAGAAAADMVERGEAARHVVGRIEGCRASGDEPDALCYRRERRQQRERLERGHGMTALERVERHVEHGHVVGHEEGVELAGLKLPGEALQVPEIEVRIGIGAGIAPGAGVDARRTHERTQPQLTRCRHRGPLAVLSTRERAPSPFI